MKILISECDQGPQIATVETNEEVTIEECYTGVGIKTDCGLYGVCQRDGGLVVMLDGEPVFVSDSDHPRGRAEG